MKTTVARMVFAILATASLTHCANAPGGPASAGRKPVLLAIFAHPDDESTVGPVLAKYAAEGAHVYLAVATDGRLGVSQHAGIPAGDELAKVRTQELQCAAAKLGIEAPIQFGLEDQLKMAEGLPAHGEQLRAMRDRITGLFEQLQPDAVITWGPSGWTGHPDHRLVGSIVTEVFQGRHWERPAQLYYSGLPTSSVPASNPIPLATVDPRFLTTRIAVSPADNDKAREAWLCHKSQYTAEQVEQLRQPLLAAQAGAVLFQPLVPGVGKKDSLLRQ
jgi:LmbE family N-acetylglucosaminyl deacetylase